MARTTEKSKIIDKLVEAGMDKQDLTPKGLDELKEILKTMDTFTAELEQAEISVEPILNTLEDDIKLTDPVENTKVERWDKEWTPYVLSLLDPDTEVVNGNPRTDGLRRVAEFVYGPMWTQSHVIECPREENGYRSVIKVNVSFENGVSADGVADAFNGNTDRDFSRYITAIAETRAEGRALRKALRLVKVLAAEETEPNPSGPVIDTKDKENKIPKEMISGLKVMAESAKIDILRLALSEEMKVEDLSQLTRDQGNKLSNLLSKIKRGEITPPDGVKNA